jgi:hypothetical protein
MCLCVVAKRIVVLIFCSMTPLKALLSHKHGCKLLPNCITESEYTMIIDDMKETKIDTNFKYGKFRTADLFNHCYKRDDNEIPALYKITDRDSIIPGFQVEVNSGCDEQLVKVA